MSEESAAVCFTCGQPSGDILRLNYLPGGQPCPACRDRLLEGIPAPLPSRTVKARENGVDEWAADDGYELEDEGADAALPNSLTISKGPGRLLQGDGPVEPA